MWYCVCHFCFCAHKSPLGWLLYLADTLAFLPYSTLEEPLFVVHHIEMTISVTGSSRLQQFKEVSIGSYILRWCLVLMLLLRFLVWMLHMMKIMKQWRLYVWYIYRLDGIINVYILCVYLCRPKNDWRSVSIKWMLFK